MGRRFDKAVLREALLTHHPWLDRDDIGPRAVSAGECERCGEEARLVETCGPIAHRYIGRECAREIGTDAWCDGHAEDARRYLAWIEELPAEADAVARLWWVATGEAKLDPDLLARSPDLAAVVAGVLDDPDA